MIHFALLGSIERFIGVFIEHTAGKFPVWVAPEQVRLLTVNQEEKTIEFAEKILEQAKKLNIRLTIDNDNESVGKKIRSAELYKVPYVVVIGDKEIKSTNIMPRIRKDLVVNDNNKNILVEDFLMTVAHETKSRVLKSSL
jgi:threonyl-tRNA synthetase